MSMAKWFSNVKFIIWSGFVAVIILMLILSGFMMYKMKQQAEQFNNVVNVNNLKVSLSQIMRDSIRSQSLTLSKMLLTDDKFFKEKEKVNLDIFGNNFINAFDDFKKIKLNNKELILIKSMQTNVDISDPLNKKVSSMLLSIDNISDIKSNIIAALNAQDNTLAKVDELITLQKNYTVISVSTTQENMNNMLTLLIVVVSIAIVFSIIVSQTISNIISLKNKEIEKVAETKSMFLANMSHEIRTPLTAIIGFAKSQMLPNLPTAHNERTSKIILRNSEHLLSVINDILDYSEIESHNLEFEYTEFSLFKLMDDVHFSLNHLIDTKPLKFSINYNYPLPKTIRTDKLRLRQIVFNLCSNAIKFTDEGSITVNIRYDHLTDNIYFGIADSGIGMTKEQQDRVFQTFSQADISTTRKYGGTGLGLTISRQLCNYLGGDLNVVSEFGIGSTFSFNITNKLKDIKVSVTLINQDSQITQETSAVLNLEDHDLVSGSILLVEDVLDNQELIAFYLEEMGATVTIVDNGKKALQVTQDKRFDLVLMDMQMPVMGGLEAVHCIRERGDDCPIVMLTANAAKHFKEESLNAGCDGFLCKPLDEQALFEVVQQHLERVKPVTSFTANTRNIQAEFHEEMIISTLLEKDSIKYSKFIAKFINYLPNYVDEIGKFIKVKNDKELKIVTHKLKGVGGNMGFKVLTDISANFEIAIKQGNRDEIARQFDALKAAAKKIYRGNELQDTSKTA